jgi:dolichyl-phosphate-mannose-protein mannosyltransferase
MIAVIALTLISLVVRLYALGNPDEIVFDEVHFGGFASKYIASRFFFDVHPPV